MKVTVVMETYRRAWALPYSLSSLAEQSRLPDEVVIVLKPSGDGSEEIIAKYSEKLPIRTLIQQKGNVTDAVQMAIDNARGDLLIFIDDDAVAEPQLVEKYLRLFSTLPDAGGIGGEAYKAYLDNGLKKTDEKFYLEMPTRKVFYRTPLSEYVDYVGWISRSGFMGVDEASSEGVFKSALLAGLNMAWRIEAIRDCPLARLYKRSKKGFHYESLLAYCAKRKGYETYRIKGELAPKIWHIVHTDSLTGSKGFWQEFWIHYDRVADYWRYKALSADVSLPLYLAACIVTLRRKPLPRLLATLYTWIFRI